MMSVSYTRMPCHSCSGGISLGCAAVKISRTRMIRIIHHPHVESLITLVMPQFCLHAKSFATYRPQNN
jgi:hypothetical protein